MAVLSIIQLVLSVSIVLFGEKNKMVCIPMIFLVFSWVFHCGQIVVIGLHLNGVVYLDFRNYSTGSSQALAFVFYLIAQSLIVFGSCCFNKKTRVKKEAFFATPVNKRMSLTLMAIGLVPRLYYDSIYLFYSWNNSYGGTAVVYIPQIINTLAFFADAAAIMLLFVLAKEKASKGLFWFVVVILYKGLTMLSGMRKEAFVFLLLWVIIYLFVINKTSLFGFVVGLIVMYIVVALIMSIGNVRTSTSKTFETYTEEFVSQLSGGFIADLLGESGSAFTTLAKTVNDTGSVVSFGFGKSYLAGLLTSIPLLLSFVPTLSGSTTYIMQFDNVSAFGGSYLGEFYYNYCWLGLVLAFLLGVFLSKINSVVNGYKKRKTLDLRLLIAICITILLLMFVRGYFSGMVQKMVWLIAALFMLKPMANHVSDASQKRFAVIR